MKTKLLTLALFGLLTMGFISCSDDEVTPSQDIQLNEKADRNNPGGAELRDR